MSKAITEDLSISYLLKEAKADSKKKRIVATVLEKNILSLNGRFYSAAIVEAVAPTLVGKPMLVDHDSFSPDRIVARIKESQIQGNALRATFVFGTDEHSRGVFQKIADGLIQNVSIRASGSSKSGQIDGKPAQIVTHLEIASVDLVTESGIPSAVINHVFESTPKIHFTNESDLTTHAFKRIYTEVKTPVDQKYILARIFDANEEFRIEKTMAAVDAEIDSSKSHLYEIKKIVLSESQASDGVVLRARDAHRGFVSLNALLASDKLDDDEKRKVLRQLLNGRNGNKN